MGSAVLTWIMLTGCNGDRISRLEQQQHELSTKLDLLTKASNIDLQERCATQAQKFVEQKKGFYPNNVLLSSSNHYSTRINKCFVRLYSTGISANGETIYDGFEDRVYAQCSKMQEWKSELCYETLSGGKLKELASREEYEVLIKQFMEN